MLDRRSSPEGWGFESVLRERQGRYVRLFTTGFVGSLLHTAVLSVIGCIIGWFAGTSLANGG